MQLMVDRIENEYLVVELENGNIVDIPREVVPDAKEGDIIDIFINKEETKNRKEEVRKLMDDLFVD